MALSKTRLRMHLRTVRREAGWLNTAMDAYGIERLRSEPKLVARVADALDIIDGTSAIIREDLLGEDA